MQYSACCNYRFQPANEILDFQAKHKQSTFFSVTADSGNANKNDLVSVPLNHKKPV